VPCHSKDAQLIVSMPDMERKAAAPDRRVHACSMISMSFPPADCASIDIGAHKDELDAEERAQVDAVLSMTIQSRQDRSHLCALSLSYYYDHILILRPGRPCVCQCRCWHSQLVGESGARVCECLSTTPELE
jgi:hypothetical protein